MANRFFLNVNGDLADTVNWAATRGGAGGQTAPSGSDDAYFETGAIDITAGTLTAATCYYSAPINLGASGVAITCTIGTAFYITGNREFMNVAGSGTCPLLSYKPVSGRLSLSAGTWTASYLGSSGRCEIGASAVMTSLHTGGCAVTAEYNATGFTLLDALGGNCDGIARSIATLYGGTNTLIRTTGVAAISTRAVIFGKLLHHSSGTIAEILVGNGGKATSEGGAYPFTVTASTAGANGYCFENERNVTKTAPTFGLFGS